MYTSVAITTTLMHLLITNTNNAKYSILAPCTPASSTTKTGRHDIAEILLKVALTTINQLNQIKALKSHDLT
jgi:hypothetical protein